MAAGLEPVFTPGQQVWPLAGMALAKLEPDDPDLAIPRGALQTGLREEAERIRIVDQSVLLEEPPAEPLRIAATGPAVRKRKWTAALVASCIFHAAVAAFFIGMASEEALLEGSKLSGIAFLGSVPVDQVSAGDLLDKNDPNALAVTMITMLEAKPVESAEAETAPAPEATHQVEVVEAEPSQTEMLQPMAEQPLEPAPPDEPAQATASERTEQVSAVVQEPAQAAVETLEILAADTLQPVEDDQAVPEIAEAGPAETIETARTAPVVPTAPADPAEPIETATLEPAIAETLEAEPEIPLERIPLPTPRPTQRPAERVERTEQPKPRPEKKTAQTQKPERKPSAKQEAKTRQSGNGGRNESDAQRGQADGQADGRTAASSKGGKNSAVGNAAVSNYPGKIVSRLRRALRYPAEAKRKRLRGEAHVHFTVSGNGGVGSVRVVKSSGSAVLDKAAADAVRRAAPFPPIPAGAGRSNWRFTVPLAFTR